MAYQPYRLSKVGVRSRRRPKKFFSIPATTQRRRRDRNSFPRLLHFTLNMYLIMLSVKEGGIKYHFFSLCSDSTWDWTPVSHLTTTEQNKPKKIVNFIVIRFRLNILYLRKQFLFFNRVASHFNYSEGVIMVKWQMFWNVTHTHTHIYIDRETDRHIWKLLFNFDCWIQQLQLSLFFLPLYNGMSTFVGYLMQKPSFYYLTHSWEDKGFIPLPSVFARKWTQLRDWNSNSLSTIP